MMKLPLLFALAGTCCGAAWAQTEQAPAPAPLQQPSVKTVTVPIRNVKASLMAWWLFPLNPKPLTAPSLPSDAPRALPAGINDIVAVDPQNLLKVTGTTEGLQNLAPIIRSLDKPLRQVEIEARFFQIAPDSIEKLGLALGNKFSQDHFSRVTGDINAVLEPLQAQKKAVLISSPRITAINNLMATLSSQTLNPTKLRVESPEAGSPRELSLALANSRSLEITPTINNDDTVTLTVDVERGVNLEDMKGVSSIVLNSQKVIHTNANMRDGETIALEEDQLQGPHASRKSTPKTILFLTTHLIQPAGK